MQRVAVIGSGIAGLASSVRLAHMGYAVDVFEAADGPGGKLREFRLGPYRFDAGPSLFTMPHYVDALFRLCGEDPRDHFHYRQLDPVCRYFWEDGKRYTAPANNEQLVESMAQTFDVPVAAVKRHLAKSKAIYRATHHVFLERSLHKWSTYMRWQTMMSMFKMPLLDLHHTMHSANKARIKNEQLVQLFNRYATYNGSDPYQAPGLLNVIPNLEYEFGAWLPEGGMYSITRAISELASRQGVSFHFNTPVEEITVKGKQVTGIRVGDKELPYDLVISNMDVVPTFRKLLPHQTQPERVLKQERSSSALIFYWGIRAGISELDVHNIFFSSDYAKEFKVLFGDKSIYKDPTVYVNITSIQEKGDAPPGGQNWFVMVNAPHVDGQDWEDLIARTRAIVIAKLNRVLKVELEPLIEVERCLDPILIETQTSSFKGALYGTSSNSRLAAFMRHANFSRTIKGLYFCGGSVHPGGGIPLCLLSAAITAGLIGPPNGKHNEY